MENKSYRSQTRTGLLGHFKATSLELSREGREVGQLQEHPSSQNAWIRLIWESPRAAASLTGSSEATLAHHLPTRHKITL